MGSRLLRWELVKGRVARQAAQVANQRESVVSRAICSTRLAANSARPDTVPSHYRFANNASVRSLESSHDDDKETLRNLLNLLNADKRAKTPRLPLETTRIDAYLYLKRNAPALLSEVTDAGLDSLCLQASSERLGGLVGSLLEDLEGQELFDDNLSGEESEAILQAFSDARRPSQGGLFAAAPGSQRRISAVQNLLLGSTKKRTSEIEEAEEEVEMDRMGGRAEALLSSTTLERALKMLIEDYRIIARKRGGNGVQMGSILPFGFDTRVARRLIRSIAASKLGHLEPVLSELIKHVNHDKEYEYLSSPTDGWQLLDYYLSIDEDQNITIPPCPHQPAASSSAQDLPVSLQAANAILDRMASLQSESVNFNMLQSVSKEGQKYKAHLEGQGISEKEAAKFSIRYTLRNIIVLLLLKTKRYNLLADQLDLMLSEMEQVAARHDSPLAFYFPAELVLDSIYLSLTLAEDFKVAFQLAKQFVGIWMQAEDREQVATLLQSLCNKAVDINEPHLASDLLLLCAAGRHDSHTSQMAAEVEIVGGPTIMRILDNHQSNGRGDVVAIVLQQLGIISFQGEIPDDAIDRVFPEPLRARLIITLARVRLRNQCKALYERWAVPLKNRIEPKDIKELIGQVMRPMSQKIPSTNEKIKMMGSEVDANVRGSSSCIVHLIRLFRSKALAFAVSEDEVNQSEMKRNRLLKKPNNQFAYHILLQFHKVEPYSRYVERSTFVDLAKAYLYLGHRKAAFKCLRDTVDREDSASLEEAAVLINLMGRVDLEEAVNLIVECMPLWIELHAGNEAKLAQMYTPLLESALQRGQRALVERLLQSAHSIGLENDSGIQSIDLLIRFAMGGKQNRGDLAKAESTGGVHSFKDIPGGETAFLARWVADRVKRYNWKPTPMFISWMAVNAIRPGGLGNTMWHSRASEIPRLVEEPQEVTENDDGDALSSMTNDGIQKNDAKAERNPSQYSLLFIERSASVELLSLAAKHFNYLDLKAASEIVKCIQNSAYRANQSRRKEAPIFITLTKDLDTISSLLRWTPALSMQGQFLKVDENATINSISGQPSQHPNKLPAQMYRTLMVAYMRVGDLLGAASTLAWARDEAHLSFEQLALGWKGHDRGFKNFIKDLAYKTKLNRDISTNTFLAWLAGTEPIPKSKLWWQRP